MLTIVPLHSNTVLVDAVMDANATSQSSEPRVLYCAIARCASCGRHHASPTTGVMFDRCACGGYLFALAGAWNPDVDELEDRS